MRIKSYILIFLCLSTYNCASGILVGYSLENSQFHSFAPKNSSRIYYSRAFGYEILYCKCRKDDLIDWMSAHNFKDHGKEMQNGNYEQFIAEKHFRFQFRSVKFDVLAAKDKLIKKIYSNNGGYEIYYDEVNEWLYYEWHLM